MELLSWAWEKGLGMGKEEEGAEGKGSREIKDPPGSGGVDRLGQDKKPLLRQKSDQ